MLSGVFFANVLCGGLAQRVRLFAGLSGLCLVGSPPAFLGLSEGVAQAQTAAAKPTAAPRAATPKGPPGKAGKVALAGPKPLAMPPKSPVLTKADIYQKAAAATVFLIAAEGSRFNTALGVVVHPNGTVVTDSRILSGVEKGTVTAFLYDPSFAGDEDPLIFLRANQDKALAAQVVRQDGVNHLLMLQLPSKPPKQAYKSLDLFDVKTATAVGMDVIGLRTRGRQTLAMLSSSIMAVRPGAIETDPPLTNEHTGGALLSMNGRLLGIVTFADKAVGSPGVAHPVEQIYALLNGSSGAAVVVPQKAAPDAVSESPNAVEAVRIALGNALAQKFDKRTAQLLHGEFVSSMALRGRLPVRQLDSIGLLSGLVATITKDSPAKAKVVAELFPLLVTDKTGRAFWRDGTKYAPVPTSEYGVVTIDDATGMLFATDKQHSLNYYDATGKSWRPTHLTPVADAAVTQGTLYAVMADGRLLKATFDGKDSMQIWPKLLTGAQLVASLGTMYLLDSEKIYRYRKGMWDSKMQPIAFAMRQFIVRGDNYYGMDINGRVFSSAGQRYIDRDANIFKLWPVGRDLLVLTKDNQRFFYSSADDQWQPWPGW